MDNSFEYYDVKVIRTCAKTVRLELTLKNKKCETILSYSAAKPPDYRQSYTGSALPFPDAQIAYQNSPNIGKYNVVNNFVSFKIYVPNSYYSHVGTRLILPHVRIDLMNTNNKIYSSEIIELGEIAPFRMLSYPSMPVPRDSPGFYSREHLTTARTQEAILRSSGYTLTTPPNFWNGGVPHP